MTELLGTAKDRVVAGLAGAATAFVTWPVPAGLVMLATGSYADNNHGYLLLAVGMYGWQLITVVAGVITACVSAPGRGMRGGFIVVGVALSAYAVFAVLSVIIAGLT